MIAAYLQNKKQCLSLLFILCCCFSSATAKKLKIRSCTLPNGETVLMDKACPVNSKVGSYKKPKKKTQTRTKKHWHQQSASNSRKKQPKTRQQTQTHETKHKPGDALSLDALLASVKSPSNWHIQSFPIPKGDAITVSPKRLIRPNALKTGASIQRFTNTVKHFKKSAFSVAIDKFHNIRFDENIEMTESEFIAHNKFKVFNVHYQKQRLRKTTIKVVVQFYVDEVNDDLYVLQFQAPKAHWARLITIKNQLFSHIKL